MEEQFNQLGLGITRADSDGTHRMKRPRSGEDVQHGGKARQFQMAFGSGDGFSATAWADDADGLLLRARLSPRCTPGRHVGVAVSPQVDVVTKDFS